MANRFECEECTVYVHVPVSNCGILYYVRNNLVVSGLASSLHMCISARNTQGTNIQLYNKKTAGSGSSCTSDCVC
jgi:hypothetical protein